MQNLSTVLLLGGSQHLRAVPVAPDFGTPISHCNGVELPERYHRAVFYPSALGAETAQVWYVYVTDDYQFCASQLTEAQLLAELRDHEIAPHIASIAAADLQHERRLTVV